MPELIFRHVDDVPPREMRAQLHGARRAGAHIRRLESAPHRTVIHTDYDPGIVIGAHGHRSDHVVFVLEGLLHVGDVACRPGTMVLLEHGAVFGPLVAGPDGATMLEFYIGDTRSAPADPAGFREYLAERGIVPVEPTGLDRSAPTGRPAGGIVRSRTTLEVDDVAASTDFYRVVLGLQPRSPFDEWSALLEGGGAALGLVWREEPTVGSAIACTFEVTDVDAAHARCEAANATVEALSDAAAERWGMRSFVVADPDGHRIAIGEVIT